MPTQYFRLLRLLPLLLLCFILTGCPGIGERNTGGEGGAVCADLVRMPQDLEPYAKKAGNGRALLSAPEQAEHTARAISRFFSPWQKTEAGRELKRSLEANFNLRLERAYGEDLRPFDPAEWQNLRANANVAAYPSRAERAITVRNTAMRAMPTQKPFFLNPSKAGEGYPFDYFQHTALWTGTPIFISHISADGAWVLGESQLTVGWIPATDVAFVDDAFAKRWQTAPLAAFVRDNVELASTTSPTVAGKAGVRAHIGTLLPSAGSGRVWYPQRGSEGNAEIATASVDSGAIAPLPLPLTPAAIARVGNNMMGQPYGWGGLFENRDCSALMHDLFIPFGLWLPRNSATQGSWGQPVILTGMGPEDKENRILAEGIPFFSLLWLRGHIGLYIGEFEGKPAMFHNVWGIRTLSENGDSGRAVIGKAVVTSLRPGAELANAASAASLIQRIERLSILPESDSKVPVMRFPGAGKKVGKYATAGKFGKAGKTGKMSPSGKSTKAAPAGGFDKSSGSGKVKAGSGEKARKSKGK